MSLGQLNQDIISNEAKTRMRAVFQMGIIGDPTNLDALNTALKTDPSPEIRALAKYAIDHVQATAGRSVSQDAEADVEWTKKFIQFIDTSSFIFNRQDIDDLAQLVSKNASKFLQSHVQATAGIGQRDRLGVQESDNEQPPSKPLPKSLGGKQGERVEIVGTYQMLWDCHVCATKELLGVTHRHCPNCGAAQDPKYRYFPEPGKEIALENHHYVGVDKICPACEGLNAADANFCGNCGSGLDAAAEAQRLATQTEEKGFTAGQVDPIADQFQIDVNQPRAFSSLSSAEPKLLFGKPRGKIIVGGVIGTLLLAVASCLFVIFYQTSENVTVTDHKWEQVVVIQDFAPRSETKDCEDMPGAAYSVSRRTEQRSRQVADGQTCREECSNQRVDNGDGSFSSQRVCRDVCQTKYKTEYYNVAVCSYTIDRWQNAREVKASGNDLNPQAPVFSLSEGDTKGYGAEREKELKEKYTLYFKRDNGKVESCEYEDQKVWSKYAEGDRIEMAFNLLGQPDCDSIK